MAGLTPKEKLQPSLLDRLTDVRPDVRTSTAGVKVLSMEELRDGVRRDLAALFNATALETVEDLTDYPNVQKSTLNFGMPDLSGKTASGMDLQELERSLSRAIHQFEPRLIDETVKVSSDVYDAKSHNCMIAKIEAELWSQPLPQKLLLRTELDLENGEVKLKEEDT
ncbi:MAG TPA: type VI secretion system baseplate subunit TssE [Polyangiaceae bacterium]|nr:type VI secretion system baseplate subunit TssE [Polyangiaceae bacterium]